jgi:hypothetical protein
MIAFAATMSRLSPIQAAGAADALVEEYEKRSALLDEADRLAEEQRRGGCNA